MNQVCYTSMSSSKNGSGFARFEEIWLRGRPRLGSASSQAFFESWAEICAFFALVLDTVVGLDAYAEAILRLNRIVEREDEIALKNLEDYWKNRVSAADHFEKRRQFFLEIVLVRHVENYLNYLSSLLEEIFTRRPETLKSSEKVELELVLSHSTMDDFVKTIAERKVDSLSYSSFQALRQYFCEHFGLEICAESDLNKFIVYAEIRNISVHNRCVVNHRYLERTGSELLKAGELRQLYRDDIFDLVALFKEAVKGIDKLARKKFNLTGHRFKVDDLNRAAFSEAFRMGIMNKE